MAPADVIARVNELGDRVNGHPEHVPEVLPELLSLLESADDPTLLVAIVNALHNAWDEQASTSVLPLIAHPNVEVRRAVAKALPTGLTTREAEERVAEALMSLCGDADDEVRDWATFGLGTQLDVDTRPVRDLLLRLTSDASRDVRDEALVGLARRRDARASDLVANQLAGAEVGLLAFEAAAYLADPRLRDLLAEWRDIDPDDDRIRRAYRACDPDTQRAVLERCTSLLGWVQGLLVERGLPGTVALMCDRFTTEVLLIVDTSPHCWSVDAVLEHAKNDPEQAARSVVTQIELV